MLLIDLPIGGGGGGRGGMRARKARLEYFRAAGWNENGVLKPETLRRLGLEDVEAKLRETDLIR